MQSRKEFLKTASLLAASLPASGLLAAEAAAAPAPDTGTVPEPDSEAGYAWTSTQPPRRLPADYYQQFNADYSRDVPGEGYGGWKRGEVEISSEHTAVVSMHAWYCPPREQNPGIWRCCEYLPRAAAILENVYPPLLAGVRASSLPLFHVVGGGGRDYWSKYPGYAKTMALAGRGPTYTPIGTDPVYDRMQKFRWAHCYPGPENLAACEKFLAEEIDFAPQARPEGDEFLVENGHQLAAVCRARRINHLIYIGFAINWCQLVAPGGMVDVFNYGLMCSTIREAVTAVENRETARTEAEKREAFWRISIQFGFIFGLADFLAAIRPSRA